MAFNDIFPTRAAAIEALPDPTYEDFIRGGEHLGILREFIKCKAPNGEYVRWGSPERVSLPIDDLERLAERIARAGAQHWKDEMERRAQHAESHESWPGWLNDPGQMVAPRGYEVYETESGWAYRKLSEPRNPERQMPYRQQDEEEFAYYCAWRQARREWEEHTEMQALMGTDRAKQVVSLLEEAFHVAFFSDDPIVKLTGRTVDNIATAVECPRDRIGTPFIEELWKLLSHCRTFEFNKEVMTDEEIVKAKQDAVKLYAESLTRQKLLHHFELPEEV